MIKKRIICLYAECFFQKGTGCTREAKEVIIDSTGKCTGYGSGNKEVKNEQSN